MPSLDHPLSVASAQHASRSYNPDEGGLEGVLAGLRPDIRSQWAWDNYQTTVEALARAFALRDLIEIGGGRDPLMTPARVGHLGLRYTVNDISTEELRHAPDSFGKARFDICGSMTEAGIASESYDLAFSRMVFEHVRDGRAAWRNLCHILRPGGVALAFVPTLYALPYVANLIVPEWISARIVKALYPHRTDHADPKFPAHYSWCFSSERKMAPMLRDAGFSESLIVPFYGHAYFEKLPLAREIDEALTRLAIRFDWRVLTPYAYILARK